MDEEIVVLAQHPDKPRVLKQDLRQKLFNKKDKIGMSDILLATKSVKEIIDEKLHFFIPDYQRGYRWEEDEVVALLNDIEEFAKNPKGFYCLQSLAVVEKKDNKDNNEWEVVDGQQRLTTIFLILRQINNDLRFQICYERHPECEEGLAGLLEKLLNSPDAPSSSSPDFYYIKKANNAITSWLGEKNSKLLSSLGKEGGPDVRFIWYTLSESDAIPAFNRLNAGKIKLTEAELIRALFLRSDVLSETNRLQMAISWDKMERRFNEPEFWSFLTPRGYQPENRIELLLRQVAKVPKDVAGKRAIFDFFEGELILCIDHKTRCDKTAQLWQVMEDIFSRFEEWFENKQLFHLIGFLIENGIRLETLLEEARAKDKKEFQRCLIDKIREKVLPLVTISEEKITEYLNGLNYSEHGDKIRTILLCFNLGILMSEKKETVRFSFHAYKSEANGWDIEHIRATASRGPQGIEELKEALKVIAKYITERPKDNLLNNNDMVEKIKESECQTELEVLQGLYQSVIETLEGEKETEDCDKISNLTLLDAKTNRGYGNSPFQIKRAWILGLAHQAKYVLPCTRSVFTKGYSLAPEILLNWTPSDAADYLAVMSKTLFTFFNNSSEACQ